ncbi:hypothetical protein N7493_001148 [Penicillium malachiteum]|uniref:Uncharacterized protein n=1 Tax=Penicillium malachiteum TaxID=1324776 RepID=A0AAD6HUB2_9EURO|nr:hypothetical protein N7493_001148 [Penicillium malachiteum]
MVAFSFTIWVAALASSALASQPDIIQRETIENGSPLYECHLACGEVILQAESSNYCSSSNYTTDLSECLKCAETCEIWKYYGTEVKEAAGNCSDSATPSSSSTGSTCASTTGASTATGTANAATTTATTTGTTTATGSTASATGASAASTFQQNIVFTGAMGVFVWAFLA